MGIFQLVRFCRLMSLVLPADILSMFGLLTVRALVFLVLGLRLSLSFAFRPSEQCRVQVVASSLFLCKNSVL